MLVCQHMSEVYQELQSQLGEVSQNEKLAPFTSFKIGGPAQYFFSAKTNEDLIKSVKLAISLSIKYFILGNGSNILISDKGFPGLVIKQDNMKISYDGTLVTAASGVRLQKLVRDVVEHNLTGLEYLIGIPGTIGGGVAGNVGTPQEGQWISENIVSVEILDSSREISEITKASCDFSYRNSRFKKVDNELIVSAKFELRKSTRSSIDENIKNFLRKRSHQPINLPCAGSIFRNPAEKKSWKLIDDAGLRGKKIGGAQVSEEHTNFIVNAGDATAEDVVILISYIKQQIRDKYHIQLQEEIKYIGF